MSGRSIIDSLFAIHRGELVAYVEKRVGSRAVAEDVVQQAVMRAFEAVHGLRDPAAGRAWLFRITRRVVADHFRARSEAGHGVALASTLQENDLGCACVLANLDQLKPEFAYVLRRVILEGTSLAAFAFENGLSANAATVRLSRARAALRAQLRAHCGTSSLRECLDCACGERGCCEALTEIPEHEA
jgi:DNA-directed RNA polymerase specialized sigma24 family protein